MKEFYFFQEISNGYVGQDRMSDKWRLDNWNCTVKIYMFLAGNGNGNISVYPKRW